MLRWSTIEGSIWQWEDQYGGGTEMVRTPTSWDDCTRLKLIVKRILLNFSSFTTPCAISSRRSKLSLAALARKRPLIFFLRSVLAVLQTEEVSRVFSQIQPFIAFPFKIPVDRGRYSPEVAHCTSECSFPGLVQLTELPDLRYQTHWRFERRFHWLRNSRCEALGFDSMAFCTIKIYSFCKKCYPYYSHAVRKC